MGDLNQSQLESLIKLVEEAAALVMTVSRQATKKPDGSDVTAADMASHTYLMDGIQRIIGADARILSEEEKPLSDVRKGIAFVIDPLDGTSNFVAGRRNFSVLLSILKDGMAVYGIVVSPAYGLTACGGPLVNKSELRLHNKTTAQKNYREIRALTPITNQASVTIVPERFLKTDKPEEMAIIKRAMDMFQDRAGKMSFQGSSAVLGSMLPVLNKHIRCRLYDAIRPNQRPGDWDLAPWDAILRGAGGIMTALDGKSLVYGQTQNNFLHQGFISWRAKVEAEAYSKITQAPKNSYHP